MLSALCTALKELLQLGPLRFEQEFHDASYIAAAWDIEGQRTALHVEGRSAPGTLQASGARQTRM